MNCQHQKPLSLLSLDPAEHVTSVRGSPRWTENNADDTLNPVVVSIQYKVHYTYLARRTQCAREGDSSEEKELTQLTAPVPLSHSSTLTAYHT